MGPYLENHTDQTMNWQYFMLLAINSHYYFKSVFCLLQLHFEDGGSKVLQHAGILPHHYTWCHNTENSDTNLQCHEYL